MRTTITIDDELFNSAIEVSDPTMNKAEVIREALKAYVHLEASRRLAALGGSDPDMRDVPRRRYEDYNG